MRPPKPAARTAPVGRQLSQLTPAEAATLPTVWSRCGSLPSLRPTNRCRQLWTPKGSTLEAAAGSRGRPMLRLHCILYLVSCILYLDMRPFSDGLPRRRRCHSANADATCKKRCRLATRVTEAKGPAHIPVQENTALALFCWQSGAIQSPAIHAESSWLQVWRIGYKNKVWGIVQAQLWRLVPRFIQALLAQAHCWLAFSLKFDLYKNEINIFNVRS